MLGEIAGTRRLGVVLVTHDDDIASRWAHRRITLT